MGERRLPVGTLDDTKYSAHRLDQEQLATLRRRSGRLILTDDYAPVDNLLAPVIRMAERN